MSYPHARPSADPTPMVFASIRLSAPQRDYMRARAAADAAREAQAADVALIAVAQPTREEIRAGVEEGHYCETHPYYVARSAIEDRHQYCERLRELCGAELALIEWGAWNAQKALNQERWNQIKEAFENGPRLHGELRRKLLGICLSMEVTRP